MREIKQQKRFAWNIIELWTRHFFSKAVCVLILVNVVNACEIRDVWLYVGATESEAQSQTRIKQFLCDEDDPYWYRIKWEGIFSGVDEFEAKLFESGTGTIYVDELVETDREWVDWNNDTSYLTKDIHSIKAAVRYNDIEEGGWSDWVWSDDTGGETYATVAINEDPGEEETQWLGPWNIGECPIGEECPSTATETWPLGGFVDDCGHYLKVKCVPIGGGCRFNFYYDTTLVGFCPWQDAGNGWFARRTSSSKWGKRRWLETKHCSFNDAGTDLNPPPMTNPQGEAHANHYCWRVQRYDCINNTDFAKEWRKTTSTGWWPDYDWDETQGSCCDGTGGIHPWYDGSCP